MSGPVKQSDLAQEWGCTRQYVYSLVKKGMPLTSMEDALQWRVRHSKEGIGHKTKRSPEVVEGQKALANMPSLEPMPDEPAPEGDGPDAVLWRVRDAERMIHEQLRMATAEARRTEAAATRPEATSADRLRHEAALALLPGLLRTHGQAVANRQTAERAWERHRLRMGLLVPFDAADAAVEARLAPLDQQLRNLPKMVAAQANPQAPAIAEAAIEAGLITIFTQISAARQPTPAPTQHA